MPQTLDNGTTTDTSTNNTNNTSGGNGGSSSSFVSEDSSSGGGSEPAPVQTSFAEKEADDALFYPHLTNKFWVDIDHDITAFFTELSGLTAETEVEYVTEGGNNSYKKAIPIRTKYSNLVLKRGWGTSPTMWYWYFNNTAQGKPSPKNLTLYIYSSDTPGVPVVTLFFYNAWPIKWKGPDLRAGDGQNFAIQELEIVYDYFESFISI